MVNITFFKRPLADQRLKDLKILIFKVSFQCQKLVESLRNIRLGAQLLLEKFELLLFLSSHLQTNQTFSLEWPWFDVLLMSLAFVLVDLENAKVPIL